MSVHVQVCELVESHVDAKRYLVAVNPTYASLLSAASRGTLEHQGGPMSAREVQAFREKPRVELCVKLREWDDWAKAVGMELPQIETFRELMLQCLTQSKTHAIVNKF